MQFHRGELGNRSLKLRRKKNCDINVRTPSPQSTSDFPATLSMSELRLELNERVYCF